MDLLSAPPIDFHRFFLSSIKHYQAQKERKKQESIRNYYKNLFQEKVVEMEPLLKLKANLETQIEALTKNLKEVNENIEKNKEQCGELLTQFIKSNHELRK